MCVEAVNVLSTESVTVQFTRYVPTAAGAVNVGPALVASLRASVASSPLGPTTVHEYVIGQTPPVAAAARMACSPAAARLCRVVVTATLSP